MKDIIHQSSGAASCGASTPSRKQWLRFCPAGMWKALLLLLVLCIELPVFAQNIQVTGNVHDEAGEPIIGASVIVVGATTGVATDFDGNFVLNNVPSNGKLKVTYIGYNPAEVKINGQSSLDITLVEDSQVLDEVVVIGYGTVKKSDLTGSVSSVDTEKLNAKGASSVIENLQGLSPGVNITKSNSRTNGGFDVEIRGKSSINSDTKPMYIVDGVICGDIDFLNPQDIERIDVLKDASSTAIYGSRATAGVIMVTTKGGLNVNKAQKASITYDGYYGFNHAARMPEFMDGRQFYNYRLMKFNTLTSTVNGVGMYGFDRAGGGLGQALLQIDSRDLSSPYLLKEMLANGQTYDWPGMVTHDGHQQNHYLAVSGSSDTANYHFGVGYNEEKGIYEGDEKSLFNFKGSVDARINKVISAGFSINVARIENGYADGGAISQAYRVNPFSIPYNSEGKINLYPGNIGALGTNEWQFSDFKNPLNGMKNSSEKRETWRMLGNVYVQLDFFKGLNFKTTFSPNYNNYRNGYFAGYINPDTGLTYADGAPETSIARVNNQRSFDWTWDNIINYNGRFGDHEVSAMALFSSSASNTEVSYIAASGVNNSTDWWNIGNSGTVMQSPDDNDDKTRTTYTEWKMLSYALRANYNYKGKYFVTGTIRWDGSSRFADGHRWGSFPSAAVAWRISEESFLQKEWLSNLKLRLSYGVTGNNTGIGNFAFMVGQGGPVYYPFGSAYSQGYYPSSIVDEDICWEKSHEWNVGLDFGFIQNRIMGSVDWYHKKSTDLLYPVDLPLEAGGVSMSTNVGSVRNTGVEVSLTTVNIALKDWNWTTTFNVATNNNKVLEINGVDDRRLKNNSPTGNLFVGQPYNNVYGFGYGGVVTDLDIVVPDHEIAREKGFTPGSTVKSYEYYNACYGLSEGMPIAVDVNGDGVIDDDDKIIYNSNPKWTGSVSSNLSYRLPKNGGMIDFSFSIYTKQKFTVASPFMISDYFDYHDRGRGKMAMDYYIPAGAIVDADGMTDDGIYINPVYQTSTHYGEYPFPNFAATNDGLGPNKDQWDGKYGSKQFVDGSYWKVKNITLGYTFSPNLLKKIACQNLRLYFTVTNPFVWTKYRGFDPEWASASTSNDGPSIVSYQIGASIKF